MIALTPQINALGDRADAQLNTTNTALTLVNYVQQSIAAIQQSFASSVASVQNALLEEVRSVQESLLHTPRDACATSLYPCKISVPWRAC